MNETETELKLLKDLDPCPAGLEYAKQFASLKDAYNACERPDYLFFALRRKNKINKNQAVTIAVRC